jgi:hypothetical protein
LRADTTFPETKEQKSRMNAREAEITCRWLKKEKKHLLLHFSHRSSKVRRFNISDFLLRF